jgi:alpha-methylacyl-CoA racemase
MSTAAHTGERPHSGCLSGMRILDLTRLAPGPYCTMQLADMGAEVIVVAGGAGSLPISAFARGKTFIGLDLKAEAGRKAFHELARTADVVVEGYRPGVARRLGIDWETLKRINPGLIYCALTGYGQDGPLSQEAGHDINYAALSGALGAIGPADGPPAFPLNLLADFAGGSLFAVIGILGALVERARTGEGQFIDVAMVDGCISLMAMHYPDWGQPVLSGRGDGLVAGSAPHYRCYRCADDRFVAVGPLERKFFENLWRGLGLPEPAPNALDRSLWPELTRRFEALFATRSRDEWVAHFAGRDACVGPVLDPAEALAHPHNRMRHPELGKVTPVLAPVMAGMRAEPSPVDTSDRTRAVLSRLGMSEEEIAIALPEDFNIAGLAWPPL